MSERNRMTPGGTTLILVRHAHTAMAGRFCGSSDPPLSARGLEQLEALNQRLQAYPITHVFSSDLQRARQTAESIADARGLAVEYFKFLQELNFGNWEGLDWDEIMAHDPEYAQRWMSCHPSVPAPEGERYEDFFQRVQYVMTAIAAQVQGGCAAVVTHAGVMRTFLGSVAQLQNVALDLAQCDYASCWEIARNGKHWYLPVASSTAGETARQAAQQALTR